ncbi:MAG: efflux RND transporter permease subunit, partial [Planctomycetota bacterium]|nr:efflux RND transporter permease subunit [Planctomycetota bacterium]
VALFFVRRMGLAFLPEFNEGSLTIGAVTLPGTSLRESDALGRAMEEILLEQPEVRSLARRTGRAELDEHALGVEASELEVSLHPLSSGGRSKDELLAELRKALAILPGMNVTIGQPISHRIDHMLSGTQASVAVKIFGEDLSRLREIAREVEAAMATVVGVVDLAVEQQADVPLLVVNFDRAALARYGIHVEEAAHTLEAVYRGHVASKVLEGRWTYDLVLRVRTDEVRGLEAIANLPIDTPDGSKVPLGAVAEVRRDIGPNTISREALERKIVVSCNVAGRDVASVVEDCIELVDPILDAEPGYRVEYGGQFESAIEARRVLTLLGAVVVIGIGFLLHLAFGTARDALLVMLNLPLALIGGIVGVFATGGVLTVASLIGFITVFGIATRNGIMLVLHIRHLQEEEGVSDFRAAVHRGALERLAPILMTALATALALVPLALGGDEPGNEIQTPMATVILFGLSTSMVLNMLVVPALYLRFGRPARSVEGGVA